MRIITWNVNSIRIRQERLVALLARHQPDALCLQELKVEDGGFPIGAIEAAGYHAQWHGQKTYNGVAVLTKVPARLVAKNMGDGADDPQARLIDVEVGGVRVLSAYVPNGSEVGSEKYAYKQQWLQRLLAYLQQNCDPTQPLALCGDFNIAPTDLDVRNPSVWADSVLCDPPVREAWQRLLDWGLVDAFRQIEPGPGHFSWWDYRNLGFQRNDGLRIDHILATPALMARAQTASIDRAERKGDKPSDHAPVLVDFADA